MLASILQCVWVMHTRRTPLAWHLTARTLPGTRPFLSEVRCRQLWSALKREFTSCYAAVIMPNHFHLVVPGSEQLRTLKWRMGVVMRSVSQSSGPDFVRWSPAPDAQPVVDAIKLQTIIRYVHLNPVRAALTRDPLAWRWSTLLEGLLLPESHLMWMDRQARGTAPSAELLRFTVSDPFCSVDSRQPLKQWQREMQVSSSRIRHALEVLGADRSPYQVQAHQEFAQMSLRKAAAALNLSERGARNAVSRLDQALWRQIQPSLAFLLANPRIASHSVAENAEKWER